MAKDEKYICECETRAKCDTSKSIHVEFSRWEPTTTNRSICGYWPIDSNYWTVNLIYQGRILKMSYHPAPMVVGSPTAKDMLYILYLGYRDVTDARSYEDFCDSYGFDIHNENARLTYELKIEQAAQLKYLLGDELLFAIESSDDCMDFIYNYMNITHNYVSHDQRCWDRGARR